MNTDKTLWQRINIPIKIGVTFAILAIILYVLGLIRNHGVGITFWSVVVGSFISALVWGVGSFIIALWGWFIWGILFGKTDSGAE